MDPVSVSFLYEKDEYVRAVRFYLRKSGTTPLWDVFVLLVILALVGVMVYFMGVTPMVIVLLVLTAVVLVMGGYLYLLSPGYQYDRMPKLREHHTLHFSMEDIGLQTATVAGVVKWDYTKFWISKTDYYLIQSRQVYTILPKRIFRDDQERSRFEAIVLAANPGIKRRVFG